MSLPSLLFSNRHNHHYPWRTQKAFILSLNLSYNLYKCLYPNRRNDHEPVFLKLHSSYLRTFEYSLCFRKSFFPSITSLQSFETNAIHPHSPFLI
ncbi:hypothetical protein CW304_29435 [Bacillus sp. UFRGS-B20]|nr:hypothetical protein CW304_29435 [Bacillus sp. UFRGS-B20]